MALTSLIQFVVLHQPTGTFRPPSTRSSFGLWIVAPPGKLLRVPERSPVILYDAESVPMPCVQCAPTPKLPLPFEMPLLSSPVGRSVKSDRAKRVGAVDGLKLIFVARRTSPIPLSVNLP